MSAAARATRLVAEHFTPRDGEMTVGGVAVSELARVHGTPLYAYDAALLRGRLALLRAHLPARFDVYFSIKANPNPAVARLFVEGGAGLEIASGAEYLRARAAGAPPERILFAGPGKSPEELALVVRRGIGEIHAESEQEIEHLARLAGWFGTPIDVAVRVNPSAAASGGAMRMGGQPAPFGFDEERLAEIIGLVRGRKGLRFSGVHMFAGTQILDADVLVGQWRHAFEVGLRAAEISGEPLRTLDLGGGLGIPYFANESDLDLAAVRSGAEALLAEMGAHAALASAHILVEPGRFLAGPGGVYLCRARAVKQSRGKTFVVTDGGMHHHLAASGNLGQVIKRDYPVVNASRAGGEATMEAALVGPLCTPLDTLARQATLAPVRDGDLVAILQSGAYGLTASPVGFLSQPMAAEVLAEAGSHRGIRPRGSFEQPLVGLP